MHLTLKKEATKPAAFNFLQQQQRFDAFLNVYNNERPHQSLAGLTRATCIHLRHADTSSRLIDDLSRSRAVDASGSEA